MSNIQSIVLGGGCFWCMEAIFQLFKGVISVRSGYTGGFTLSPTYEDICHSDTGHIEVVEITFDAEIINLIQILNIFFATHDPTTQDRQGADKGKQYKSVIFATSEMQSDICHMFIKSYTDLSDYEENTIKTEVRLLDKFYKAEESHQNYYNENKDNNPYCSIVISPKIKKVKEKYRDLLK